MHWSKKITSTLDRACDSVDNVAGQVGGIARSGLEKLDQLAEKSSEAFDADYSDREDIAKKHGFGELQTTREIEGIGTASLMRLDDGSAQVGFAADAILGLRLDTLYKKKSFLPQLNFESSKMVIVSDGQDAEQNYQLGGEDIQGSPALSGGRSVELSAQSAAQVAIVLETIMNPDSTEIRNDFNAGEFIEFVRDLKTVDGQPALVGKSVEEGVAAAEVVPDADDNSLA